ncbi:hypothetical protein [Arthrobacter sp. zg-Y40]|uniref:hypothetical protein n=1 Tax=Arthrobacter sp. zg-Y40 TaxID=2886939 RepID=UPI003FA46FE8
MRPHRDGGPTTGDNGQGLCEACNHAKEAPGWSARTVLLPDKPGHTLHTVETHTVETRTPTGHTHCSAAPPLPGAPPGPGTRLPAPLPDVGRTGDELSVAESALAYALRAA